MTEQVMADVEILADETILAGAFDGDEQGTVIVPETNVDVPENVLQMLNTIGIEHENDPVQLYLQIVNELSIIYQWLGTNLSEVLILNIDYYFTV